MGDGKNHTSISEILFLHGTCDLICKRINPEMIDYNFGIRPDEDSPSLSLHVISGPVSKLRKLSIPIPSGYRKGIVRAIYRPSPIADTETFVVNEISTGEIVDDPVMRAVRYLPHHPGQTGHMMSSSGRIIDRLITELFKAPSVSEVRVTAMRDREAVRGWFVGYNVTLNMASEEFSPWIRIDHYVSDGIGIPIFKVYGPYLKRADTVTASTVKGVSGAMTRVGDIIGQLEKIRSIERVTISYATDTGDTERDQLR